MVFRKKDTEQIGLTEAKVDRDRMKSWGGEELFNRFMELKNRLSQPENDMNYWTSTKRPHQPEELIDILDRLEAETAAKKERNRQERSGAEKVYEDDKWLVYHITTFEASRRYGAGSRWCITGKNMRDEDAYGNRYWNMYTADGVQFYFFLLKDSNDKWALALRPNGDFEIFNAADHQVNGIPDAPEVPGLPDVSVPENNYDDDDWYEDEVDDEMELDDDDDFGGNNEVHTPAPTYETEPVAVPPVFQGRTPEDAAERYGSTIVSEVIPGRLFVIELPEGKFTMFAFERGMGGPLAAQTGNGYAIIKFNTADEVTQFAQAFVTGGQQIQTSDMEEVEESFSFKLKEEIEDYRSEVEIKPLDEGDREYIEDAIRNRSEHIDWYVLHYDLDTTDYLNDIEFSNLADAWKKFKSEKPYSVSDRVELMFAPEWTDEEFEDNVVINFKQRLSK